MNFLKKVWKGVSTPAYYEDTPENRVKWQDRAPGWMIRCRQCGWEDEYGRYGQRRHAAGTKYQLAKCPQCQKWTWLVIDKKELP